MARYAKPEKWKLGQRGRALGHVTYFLNFGTPNISGMAEDTNLEFCMRIEGKGYQTNIWKMSQKGAWLGHVTYF